MFKLDIVPALVPVGELVRLVSSQLVRASKVSLQKVRLSKEARDLPDCLSFDPRSDCVKDEVGLFIVSSPDGDPGCATGRQKVYDVVRPTSECQARPTAGWWSGYCEWRARPESD